MSWVKISALQQTHMTGAYLIESKERYDRENLDDQSIAATAAMYGAAIQAEKPGGNLWSQA